MAVLQRQQLLKEVNETIRERKEYLATLERNIEVATIAASDRIRELQGDVGELEDEKSRLLRLALGLEQRIRDAKVIVEALN